MDSSTSDGLFPQMADWAGSREDADRSAPAVRSEDVALMLRIQAGEEAALRVLLERYAKLVLSIGRRILREGTSGQIFGYRVPRTIIEKPANGTTRSDGILFN